MNQDPQTSSADPPDPVEVRDAFLAMDVPPPPPAAATLAGLRASGVPDFPSSVFLRPSSFWRSAVRLTLPLAAAAAVALSVAFLFFPGGGASVALADVQQRLAEIRTAQCNITTSISLTDAGEPEVMHGTLQIKEPGRMRAVVQSSLGEVVVITDLQKQQTVTLMPGGEAHVTDMKDVPTSPATVNIIDQFRRLAPEHTTLIGQAELNGIPVQVYAFTQELASMSMSGKLWVDIRSGLPVRSEYTIFSGSDTVMSVAVDTFVWNPSLDDRLFDLTPPKDYRVTRAVERAGTEADFVALLRLWSDAREGQFPEVLNIKTLGDVVKVVFGDVSADPASVRQPNLAIAPAPTRLPDSAEPTRRVEAAVPPASTRRIEAIVAERLGVAKPRPEQVQQELIAIGAEIGRGGKYFSTLAVDRGFEWRGAGVRRGQADRVVCFWRVAEGTGFRVVYGDLRIEAAAKQPPITPEGIAPVGLPTSGPTTP